MVSLDFCVNPASLWLPPLIPPPLISLCSRREKEMGASVSSDSISLFYSQKDKNLMGILRLVCVCVGGCGGSGLQLEVGTDIKKVVLLWPQS